MKVMAIVLGVLFSYSCFAADIDACSIAYANSASDLQSPEKVVQLATATAVGNSVKDELYEISTSFNSNGKVEAKLVRIEDNQEIELKNQFIGFEYKLLESEKLEKFPSTFPGNQSKVKLFVFCANSSVFQP